jgi:hypothetical protein
MRYLPSIKDDGFVGRSQTGPYRAIYGADQLIKQRHTTRYSRAPDWSGSLEQRSYISYMILRIIKYTYVI